MSRHSRDVGHLTTVALPRVDARVRLAVSHAALEVAAVQRGQLCEEQVLERLDRATFHLIVAARYIRDPRGMWDLP